MSLRRILNVSRNIPPYKNISTMATETKIAGYREYIIKNEEKIAKMYYYLSMGSFVSALAYIEMHNGFYEHEIMYRTVSKLEVNFNTLWYLPYLNIIYAILHIPDIFYEAGKAGKIASNLIKKNNR